MKMHTAKDWNQRLMLAGAVALISQAAVGAGTGSAREPEIVRVTAPRVVAEIPRADVEVDVAALIESVNRHIAKQHETDLKAIGARRIELVMSEIPTRG
ncbi:MAG: hypothetical protein PVH89_00455 [Gammaproteobacteria bacterium]|jgi:hypothetical protein